jgi:Uma2 family endonuclease
MDTFIPPTASRRATQAAEGLPRWRWTTEELVRLTELGVFGERDKFELFGGEIVPMSPVGRRHQLVVDGVQKWLRQSVRADLEYQIERQFNLDAATYCSPDVVLWQGAMPSYDARGPDTLLLIEVADSSLQTDLGFKRHLYAQFGVREYWVVQAWDLWTRVHTNPVDGDYTTVVDKTATDVLTPSLVPGLTLRLADLNIRP